jgi:hypothetical protein
VILEPLTLIREPRHAHRHSLPVRLDDLRRSKTNTLILRGFLVCRSLRDQQKYQHGLMLLFTVSATASIRPAPSLRHWVRHSVRTGCVSAREKVILTILTTVAGVAFDGGHVPATRRNHTAWSHITDCA